MSVCRGCLDVSSPFMTTGTESLRLLVVEGIVKVAKLWKNIFRSLNYFLGFSVFFSSVQPTVHSGGVSREGVFWCDCWHWWHVTGDTLHLTPDSWQLTYVCMVATIRTHQDMHCPLLAIFSLNGAVRDNNQKKCDQYSEQRLLYLSSNLPRLQAKKKLLIGTNKRNHATIRPKVVKNYSGGGKMYTRVYAVLSQI